MTLLRKNFKVYLLIAAIFGVASFVISGCGAKEKIESKSMEEIRNEEGVPVRVQNVQEQPFEDFLTFFSTLSGIKESTKNSAIGDKIVKLSAKIGDYVKENQVIVEFPKDNPMVQYHQAKSALDIAEKTYKRMKALLEAGETAQANFDGAETQYLVAKRNYESTKQMLFIDSPISGQITELYVKEGEGIGPDKPLFTVAQLDRMKAKFWASESEVNQIKLGMPATIVCAGKEYEGRVTEVGLAMDNFKRAFGVEIQVDNRGRMLHSGVTVDVKIKTYSNPNAIILPRNLVMKSNDESFVFIESNGYAKKQSIKTGIESGINIEIIDGLKLGDRIITKGLSLIEDGKKVKVVEN